MNLARMSASYGRFADKGMSFENEAHMALVLEQNELLLCIFRALNPNYPQHRIDLDS